MRQQLARDVELLNTEYIHPKLEALIGIMITMKTIEGERPEYALKKVMFNVNNTPQGALSMYYPGNEMVEFNLKKIFETAVTMGQYQTRHMNISAIVWYLLILAMFHEMHHAWMWHRDSKWMEENLGPQGEAEELAKSWAGKMLEELVKEVDIEPPSINQMPFFRDAWAEELAEYNNKTFLDRQVAMVNNAEIYSDSVLNVCCTSIRDYLQMVSRHKDDARWHRAAKPVELLRPIPKPANRTRGVDIPPPPPIMAPAPPQSHKPIIEPEVATTQELSDMEREALAYAEAMDDVPTEFGATDDNELPIMDPVFKQQMETLQRPRATVGMDVVQQVMMTVFNRIDRHIQDKCGPRGDGWFNNPGASIEKIFVGDIPHARDVLVTMDIVDASGRPQRDVPITDWIAGSVVLKNSPGAGSALPCYKIRFTANDKVHRRAIIPQNPQKISWGAKHVAAGGAVTWVTNDEIGLTFNAATKKWMKKDRVVKKWIGFVKDGRYIACK
jgi:hypothetical protein